MKDTPRNGMSIPSIPGVKIAAGIVASLVCQLASAQSSVVLSGLVDDGITYTNNVKGHSVWRTDQGFAQSGRWGLKGIEELGDGWAANFVLENGFDINSGRLSQGGREFGRQARVGLTSAKFGTVSMGRQYDSVVDFLGPLTANGGWAGAPFSHPYDNDNTDNSFRVSNSLKYLSPNVYGFTGGTMFASGNDTDFSNNRAWSVGARYDRGPILVGAAYLRANRSGQTAAGAISTTDAVISAQGQQIWGGGVNYKVGKGVIGLSYTNSVFYGPGMNNLTGIEYNGSKMSFQNIETSVRFFVKPNLLVGGMYTYTKGEHTESAGEQHTHWNQAGLMADYFLSKRSDLYAMAVWQRLGGDHTGAGGMQGALLLGAAGVSATSNQVLVHAGIRVKF
ncbi:porin [Caballeronia mineralivorans]|uniref:porin n=1 Tax=Caballeronia mineralivorans TaxID=2010198 RepID=UPI000A3DFCAB|nr:porin [Caballeronia mineralivorans]